MPEFYTVPVLNNSVYVNMKILSERRLERRKEHKEIKKKKEGGNFRFFLLTQPPTLLPLGEVFEAIGGTALCLLVLLDVPRQLGGDVSDKEAARSQTVIMAPHSEFAVLQWRHTIYSSVSLREMINII